MPRKPTSAPPKRPLRLTVPPLNLGAPSAYAASVTEQLAESTGRAYAQASFLRERNKRLTATAYALLAYCALSTIIAGFSIIALIRANDFSMPAIEAIQAEQSAADYLRG